MSYCYTCYMSNDRDLKGVLVTNYTLLVKFNSKYSLNCICTENVTDTCLDILKNNNINVISFNFSKILKSYGINQEYCDYIINKHYYGKYLIFLLDTFDKVLYLDTDLLLLKPLDDYLENFLVKPNTLYMVYDILACKKIQHTVECTFIKNMFNSGVMFIKPDKSIFDILINVIKNINFEMFKKNVKTDQCIIQIAYTEKLINIVPLHPKFNISPYSVQSNVQSGLLDLDEVIIIHFMNTIKPWDLVEINKSPIKNHFGTIYETCVSSDYYNKWVKIYFEFIQNKYFNTRIFGKSKFINRYNYSLTEPENYFSIENFNKPNIQLNLKNISSDIKKY